MNLGQLFPTYSPVAARAIPTTRDLVGELIGLSLRDSIMYA